MNKLILSLSLSFCCLLLIFSCEESESGCLDLLSSNYSVHSVSECDSCCTYPFLKIDWNLIYDTEDFGFRSDTIFSELVDTFVLYNLQLGISDILVNGAKQDYSIRDSLVINGNVDKDDFVLLRGKAVYNVGNVRFLDEVKGINFSLGADPDQLKLYQPFENINQNSKLDAYLDDLYDEEKDAYSYVKMNVKLGSDSLALCIPYSASQRLSFDLDTANIAGEEFKIGFELDVKKLLDGIKAGDSTDAFLETFEQNIPNSISVK